MASSTLREHQKDAVLLLRNKPENFHPSLDAVVIYFLLGCRYLTCLEAMQGEKYSTRGVRRPLGHEAAG